MEPLLLLSLILAFYVAWSVGANDETMAPLAGIGLMGVTAVALVGALADFAGALAVSGAVEKTLGVKLLTFRATERDVFVILFATATWLVVASYKGWPVSTTHSAVGAAIGLALAKRGLEGINVETLNSVVGGWVFSPLAGVVGAYLTSLIIDRLYRARANKGLVLDLKLFRAAALILFFWSAYTAFFRGGNDVANATAFLLVVSPNPAAVKVVCAVGVALGLLVLGRRVIKNVGNELVELDPLTGISVQMSVALVLSIGTLLGFPLSGTHVLVSAVAGVGLARRVWINTRGLKEIVGTWIATFPGAAVISIVVEEILAAFS